MELRAGLFDVPQFDAKQHEIDGADPADVIGGLGRSDMGLAAIPLDAQPILTDRRKMGAACDKRDVRPGRRERRAIGSADAARPDHRDAHGPLLCQAEWESTKHLSNNPAESSRRR